MNYYLFESNKENGVKITMILLKHGLELTRDLWYRLPDIEQG